MTASRLTRTLGVLLCLAVVAGCANTIRGIGRDAANTVDATQNAAGNVVNAAEN